MGQEFKTFTIGNITIGDGHPPLLIAEMSGNHNQSLDRALEIVEAAAKSGAHALKIQTYTADTMTLDINSGEFVLSDKKEEWDGRSLYDLYSEAATPWEWHSPIKKKCDELGLIFFSTPFDDSSVDFLEELRVEIYKVASFECNDLQLVRKIAKTGKPIIISTGMATLAEIDETVRTAKANGAGQIILLKCTSAYPANPKNANLNTIPHLKQAFNTLSGLSDHTVGCGVAVAATALGASVIEKHFTLSRADGGVDSAFSMEPAEFKQLTVEVQRAFDCLGSVCYDKTTDEINSQKFRRSLYISKDLKAGETLTKENLRAVRPGLGLPTKYMDILLGKKVLVDAKKGTPASWDLV